GYIITLGCGQRIEPQSYCGGLQIQRTGGVRHQGRADTEVARLREGGHDAIGIVRHEVGAVADHADTALVAARLVHDTWLDCPRNTETNAVVTLQCGGNGPRDRHAFDRNILGHANAEVACREAVGADYFPVGRDTTLRSQLDRVIIGRQRQERLAVDGATALHGKVALVAALDLDGHQGPGRQAEGWVQTNVRGTARSVRDDETVGHQEVVRARDGAARGDDNLTRSLRQRDGIGEGRRHVLVEA